MSPPLEFSGAVHGVSIPPYLYGPFTMSTHGHLGRRRVRDGVESNVERQRKMIDDVLCNEAERCSQDQEWVDIMENMVGWVSTPSYTLEM